MYTQKLAKAHLVMLGALQTMRDAVAEITPMTPAEVKRLEDGSLHSASLAELMKLVTGDGRLDYTDEMLERESSGDIAPLHRIIGKLPTE